MDRQRVSQVLYNLFSNASKYSREWSAIRVTASIQDLFLTVSVADEGRGISAEQLPRLFSKFSRIDFEHGSEIEGAGLGLAICRGIVEAHGGRIWAESDGEGRGTRFTFTLPASTRWRNRPPTPPRRARPEGPPAWERVLAVDDDPQVLRYVRNVLSEAGYSVTVTSEPTEFRPPHRGRAASPRPAESDAARDQWIRADHAHSQCFRGSGHLPVRPRPGTGL